MKKVLFVVLIFLIFTTGCANKQLDVMKDIDRQNRVGLVKAYDNALYQTKVERLDIENQLIDLQSDYDLVVAAFESATETSFDDVSDTSFISLGDLAVHRSEVNDSRKKRKIEVLNSYD